MDGWKKYLGRKVFLRLKNDRVYSGVVDYIDDSSTPLVFITIIDKYDNPVTIVHTEIAEIKEEE